LLQQYCVNTIYSCNCRQKPERGREFSARGSWLWNEKDVLVALWFCLWAVPSHW